MQLYVHCTYLSLESVPLTLSFHRSLSTVVCTCACEQVIFHPNSFALDCLWACARLYCTHTCILMKSCLVKISMIWATFEAVFFMFSRAKKCRIFIKNIVVSTLLSADVGLWRTCAYYRTSTRAMCVRKCVRKGFVNCACVVGACGHIFDLRCAIALSWLIWGQTNV